MRRRLLNIATAWSAALSIFAAEFWIRSYLVQDTLELSGGQYLVRVQSCARSMVITCYASYFELPIRVDSQHVPAPTGQGSPRGAHHVRHRIRF